MQGKIIKGIAGFYYVHVVEFGVYECKAKGVFRKEKIKPLVGDNVEIEVLDESEKKGNIVKILPRQNELIRPAVANIDQALVVFAITKPNPHFNLLDRFLVMMESKEIPVVLCFNKEDIATDPQIKELEEIYETCGYPMVFVSAKEERGIEKILMNVCEGALFAGLEQVRPGVRLSDISHAIEEYLTKNGCTTPRDYTGHGIGTNVHEDPAVPNYGAPGRGPRLKKGMCLAIEPMAHLGAKETVTLDDGWTVITKDHSLAAHYEHTIVITDDGYRILTKL